MLMVDIRKAIDIVNWSFFIYLLHHLGFPPTMKCWIKECITIVTFSISLNEKIHGFINSKRGPRQGDPLSPYLFVLAMEYLTWSIKAATSNPRFNFHPKCEKIRLTHLFFFMKLFFFSRGDLESVSILFHTLIQFG